MFSYSAMALSALSLPHWGKCVLADSVSNVFLGFCRAQPELTFAGAGPLLAWLRRKPRAIMASSRQLTQHAPGIVSQKTLVLSYKHIVSWSERGAHLQGAGMDAPPPISDSDPSPSVVPSGNVNNLAIVGAVDAEHTRLPVLGNSSACFGERDPAILVWFVRAAGECVRPWPLLFRRAIPSIWGLRQRVVRSGSWGCCCLWVCAPRSR